MKLFILKGYFDKRNNQIRTHSGLFCGSVPSGLQLCEFKPSIWLISERLDRIYC